MCLQFGTLIEEAEPYYFVKSCSMKSGLKRITKEVFLKEFPNEPSAKKPSRKRAASSQESGQVTSPAKDTEVETEKDAATEKAPESVASEEEEETIHEESPDPIEETDQGDQTSSLPPPSKRQRLNEEPWHLKLDAESLTDTLRFDNVLGKVESLIISFKSI